MLSATATDQEMRLADVVRHVVRQYFDDMGETQPNNLHKLVMNEVERSLIETVLVQADGNQSRAAEMLGITRTTLRNRVGRYQLD